jgi:transcriptional regulator of met regulon
MKLYTEAEIVSFLKKEFADEINAETFMENLTPIELPSDEELRKEFDIDEFDPYDVAYLGGAMRMRNLIQGWH